MKLTAKELMKRLDDMYMEKNHPMFELITTIVVFINVFGLLVSIICTVWIDEDWWRGGVTCLLGWWLTSFIYQNVRRECLKYKR